MPRKRIIDITESLEDLRRLAADNAGTPAADSIRMLIVLSRNPAATTNDIAAMIGCTPRDVERAVAAYRARGMAGLLERAPGRGISPEQLEELRAAMSSGTLETLEEIRAWLEERFGLRYTKRGVGKLIQRELGARREWVFGKSEKKPATTVEKMMRFLNGLEVHEKLTDSINNIRTLLRNVLPDIDRVSIYISVAGEYRWSSTGSHNLNIIDNRISIIDSNDISLGLYKPGEKPSELLLQHFKLQGMPVDQYNPPESFDYYTPNGSHLGTILLWTETLKPRPSELAVQLMKRLEPFIIWLLTIYQQRYNQSVPTNIPFHHRLEDIGYEAKLSVQEYRVITMRLLGHSYQSIADSMHIARSTVHKHLTSIHRKTGTSSIVELFAKYFTPGKEVRESDTRNEE